MTPPADEILEPHESAVLDFLTGPEIDRGPDPATRPEGTAGVAVTFSDAGSPGRGRKPRRA